MRVSINIPDDLKPLIDQRAEKFHISRSSYISMCVSRQLQQDELADSMPSLLKVADKLKDVDFRTLSKLQK